MQTRVFYAFDAGDGNGFPMLWSKYAGSVPDVRWTIEGGSAGQAISWNTVRGGKQGWTVKGSGNHGISNGIGRGLGVGRPRRGFAALSISCNRSDSSARAWNAAWSWRHAAGGFGAAKVL